VSGGNFHNVYSRTVHNTAFNHVSYNGGRGGITARPTQAQEAASHEQHRQPTAMQTQHVQAARGNHALLASVNQGRPAIAATAKPGELSGRGVVAARQAGAPYKAAGNRAAAPSAANSTPRSGNSAARSQPASRPQTAQQRPESHAQSINRPAPAVREQPQARQQSAPRPQAQQSMNRPAPAAHAQPAARQQSAPRPQPQSMSRPAPAEHSQPAARQQSAPRPQAQPRAQSAPRSEGKAR
jgi:hypothetical protein